MNRGEQRLHRHPIVGDFYVRRWGGDDHPPGLEYFVDGVFYESEAAAVAGFFTRVHEAGDPATIKIEIQRTDLGAMGTLMGHALIALKAAEQKAQAASDKACEARQALPPGSSRARVTTANARWASAAEQRDKIQAACILAEQIALELRSA
jgi:hypothetical protein